MEMQVWHVFMLIGAYILQKIVWSYLEGRNGGNIFGSKEAKDIIDHAVSENSVKSKIYDTNVVAHGILNCITDGKRGYEDSNKIIDKMKDDIGDIKGSFSRLQEEIMQQSLNTKQVVASVEKLITKIDVLIEELRKR